MYSSDKSIDAKYEASDIYNYRHRVPINPDFEKLVCFDRTTQVVVSPTNYALSFGSTGDEFDSNAPYFSTVRFG
jgi:hypothetical protein